MGMGTDMWVWGMTCGYGDWHVGMGTDMWVWGLTCGYGD